MEEFLQHMLRLGDFAWELRIHRLGQLLCAPHSVADRVHRWLAPAEDDCPPPAPHPSRNFVAFLCLVQGTLGCATEKDPEPLPGPARGFLEAPLGRALPTVGHRTQFHDRMGSAHCGRGMGERMEPMVRNNTRTGNPSNAVRRPSSRGVGSAHPTATHGDL